MNDEIVILRETIDTRETSIRKKEYEALKELKKTNPLSFNIDHVLDFADIKEGEVWRLDLSRASGLQKRLGVLKHFTELEELEIGGHGCE